MKNKMMDVENVGIMQGFLNQVGEEEDELEEEEGSEESSSARILNRRPDSPEILMNNLRGDMRSIDARREELADLVGYDAAAETPETVLAMLQPVLAQQGGLGALPQSSDMAQGPQAPMPPPSGGDMGVPPPGAPPLPPGGPPPPAGGDMAALLAAGPPPGGGMAPGGPMMGGPPPEGPMIGPDGQPIPPEGMPPIQMYRGGEVQRFSNGSTEEGVTPENEEDLPEDRTSAANLLYSPELVDFAQRQAARTLAQQPTAVPTLESAMQGRLPEYERLLGSDKSASQAGMLFDIAGAALNFAANRGPRGEVLRGSSMARLAGAFSDLPAAVQKRVNDIETTQRQLRMLAIQAGEKDRDTIQNLNSKLITEKRSIFNTILTADARLRAATARGAGSPFGKGNWEMGIFNEPGLADRFAAGQTTPAETNLVNSAITSYTQKRYSPILDPDNQLPTGRFETLPGNTLPQFILDAQRMRNNGAVPPGTQVTLDRKPVTATTPDRAKTAPGEMVDAPAPLLSEGGRKPTVAGTAPLVDRPIDEPPTLSKEEAFSKPVSLWRNRFRVSGPAAAAYAMISDVPGLGDPFSDITIARSQAALFEKEVVEVFLKSDQQSVTEQKMVGSVIKLRPGYLNDGVNYGSNLIGLSTQLDEVLLENRDKASTAPGSVGFGLSPKQRTEARAKISLVERIKKGLDLPPAVYSEEDMLNLPPGTTEVLINGTTLREVDQAALELQRKP